MPLLRSTRAACPDCQEDHSSGDEDDDNDEDAIDAAASDLDFALPPGAGPGLASMPPPADDSDFEGRVVTPSSVRFAVARKRCKFTPAAEKLWAN